MSFTGGYQFTGTSGGGQNGAVFITDIEPQTPDGNVGGKVFSSGGKVLDQCVADTGLIRVHVLALTGNSNYQPSVLVEGLPVALTETEDRSVWTGTIDLDLQGKSSVSATHDDGPVFSCLVLTDVGPEIALAEFTGGYPGAQTELKAGDTFLLHVVSDTPMTRIELADFGAAQAEVFDFAATTDKTVLLTIADRGINAQSLGARLKAMNSNGSFGASYETTIGGSDDGLHSVTLNNRQPQINIGSIVYPATQGALKDSEGATVNHTIADFDAVAYTTSNGEITIANANTFEPAKSVTRNSGSYNVSGANFNVVATRTANAATITAATTVRIAHAPPAITIVAPTTRLQSGGNQGTAPVNHTLTVLSNQLLLELPQINAPGGTLQGTINGNLNGLVFTQDLQVHDNDTRGIYAFQLVEAKNLAGQITTAFTGNAFYEIGGFVTRTIAIPRFEREVDIGTAVVDTNKLVATDKDSIAMTYANDFADGLLRYTVTGPPGILNPIGDRFYWNDNQAVNNNTTGLATVTLEELP